MRARQIAPVALVLALTVAGFVVARAVTVRDARRDSEHRAEVAAAQIRERAAQAVSLTESLRRFMLDAGGTGVTSDQFARNALRWLSPADFPAAAWVEQLPDSRRPAYERRIGQPIVTPDERRTIAPTGSRSSYLVATVVSGFAPLDVPGIDLSGQPGMATALKRATRLDGVAATPLAAPRAGTTGVFLVAPAPNLIGEVLHPGYVVLFVSHAALRAAASDAPTVRITTGGTSTGARDRGGAAGRTFTAAGQRFDVVVAKERVHGAPAALPWIVLAAGLVLAALAAALGVNRARRARAQEELDRIFNLSPDVIAVADFDGHFTRVNPAAEQVLGYTQEELLTRPYLELVDPEDRERTAAEAAAIGEGKTTLSFENRYVHKDGSRRVLEWTSTPVVEERVMYGVARDVTERRRAETELARLVDEQAALRRVATLVAAGGAPEEIFAAVGDEVRQLVGNDLTSMFRCEPGDILTLVAVRSREAVPDNLVGTRIAMRAKFAEFLEAGRPVRLDARGTAQWMVDLPAAQGLGLKSAIGMPIVAGGRPWGAIFVCDTSVAGLPPEAERPFVQFTELVGTAIANAQARAELSRLADEQAALRRVAMLVAEDVRSSELFEAVAREVGTLLGGDFAGMARFEDDAVVTVGVWAAEGEHPPVAPRWQMEAGDPATTIAQTRQAARWDDWTDVPGPIAAFIRELGVRSTVGTPIVVEGRLWGALAVHSKQPAPLPPDTESRMAQFTDLVGTAIANREARAEVARLAQEQAALRRVATLVAREASQEEVVAAIAEELGRLLGTEIFRILRYEEGGTAVVAASSGAGKEFFAVGSRHRLGGKNATSWVFETGRPARLDDLGSATGPIGDAVRAFNIRSVAATPIVVEGRLWGAMLAGTTQEEPLPPETELRLRQFTELMATAIANTEARGEVERLADEQAALRRVATLVAQGAAASAVFDALAAEMQALLGADGVTLSRYEPGEEVIVVAHRGSDPRRVPPGTRVSHRGENVTTMVRRTERAARMEHRETARGPIAELVRELGVSASVGAPIVVEGRQWGVAVANWRGGESPPADTEERMAKFAELLDTAIANADTRDQLTASRARLVTEGDEARRRVVRDLHDGAQQRLVHTVVTLKLAQRALREEGGKAESLIRDALMQAEQGNVELRELAHGILPAALTRGGLRDGVDAVVERLDLPVGVDLPDERFSAEIEASAYFIVAEALTNVIKHSHATRAEVRASVDDGTLHVEIRDDGIGGADPNGHGLVGLGDRATALGGRLEIESPAGGGTRVAATLPLSRGLTTLSPGD